MASPESVMPRAFGKATRTEKSACHSDGSRKKAVERKANKCSLCRNGGGSFKNRLGYVHSLETMTMSFEIGANLLKRGLAVMGEGKELVAARVRFWSDESAWPEDPRGLIFLARAVQEVGRKLFPDTWNGDEGRSFLPTLLPDLSRPGYNDRLRAHRILHGGEMRPAQAQAPAHPRPNFSRIQEGEPHIPLTGQEYIDAGDMLAQIYEAHQPAARRFAAATAVTAQACSQGKLLAYRSSPDGKELNPIPPDAWPRLYEVVFVQCEAGPLSRPKPTGLGWTHVYIDAESLRVFCAPPPTTAPAEQHTEAAAVPPVTSPGRGLKRVPVETYVAYAEAHRDRLGRYPTRQQDTEWARGKYVVKSVFEARKEFSKRLPDSPEKREWLRHRPTK